MPRSSLTDWIDWRQPGVVLSLGLHAAVLFAGVFAFSSTKPFQPAEEASAVDVVSEQQFNEMMKGEAKGEKKAEPIRRVDRVAEAKKDGDPGEAKKEVAAEPPKVEPAKAEPKPEPTPQPTPPQKIAALPPVRPPQLRLRPPEPQPPSPQQDAEEEEPDVEPIRKAAPKPPEPKKAEPKKAPPPPQADQLTKLLEQQKREAEAEKAAEQKRIEEEKKAEARKMAEKKALEEKKAEQKRLADLKKKAEAEKAAKEAADAKKLEASIRQRLLASKEAPAATGATGQQVSRTASLGSQNATGKRLSPSDKSRLIGYLTEQMNRCLSIPPGAMPRTTPIVNIQLGRDGSIIGGPTLSNPSNEPGFRPFAEANMRALRNCAPYRIPDRFLESYSDWKNLSIGIVPSDS